MKHIKPQYPYIQITGRQYFDLVKDAKKDVDKNILHEIGKLQDIRVKDQQFGIHVRSINNNQILSPRGNTDNNIHCFITQLPDEWYCLKLLHPITYYKCDQIDGLIDCLKEIYSI